MNRIRVLFSVYILAFLISACSYEKEHLGQITDPTLDQHAVIPEQNRENTDLIRNGLTNFLNGASVQVANDVFSTNSLLVIHRNKLTGRDTGSVERFRLAKNDNNCVLIYENTGARKIIPGLNCTSQIDKTE